MTDEFVPSWERLRRTCDFDYGLWELVPPEASKSFSLAMGAWIVSDCHGFWLEPEDKDGHTDPHSFVVTIGERLSQISNAYNGKPTQSPIEDMMLAALLWLQVDWAGFPTFDLFNGPQEHKKEYGKLSDNLEFYLSSQAVIGRYKADFLLWFSYKGQCAGVVVECDGHAFHEKTKEQAAADKKRDREMLKAGFPVMRFSGSEVFKDPIHCAEQVREILAEALFRLSKSGGMF